MAQDKRNTPVKPEEKATTVVMDGHEAALSHRVHSEDDSWKHIQENDIHDFSLADDPMKFPQECYEMLKEFAFRWFKKSTDRIDEVRSLKVPKRWWIVNASSMPALESHCDPVHGAIQRLDQILFFKPRWMFDRHQQAKMTIAENQDKAGDIKNKAGIDDGTAEWVGGKKAEVSDGPSDLQIAEVGDSEEGLMVE